MILAEAKIEPLLLMALLGLGGLAAMVYFVIAAIAHKRPALALAGVAVPFALLALFIGFRTASRSDSTASTVVAYQDGAATVAAAYHGEPVDSPRPPLPPFAAMAPQRILNSWLKIGIFALLAVVAVKWLLKPNAEGERRGWGLGRAFLVFLVVSCVIWMRASYSPHGAEIALRQEESARQNADEVRRNLQKAQRELESAQRKAERERESAQRMGEDAGRHAEWMTEGDFQNLWEQFAKPRIELPPIEHDDAAAAEQLHAVGGKPNRGSGARDGTAPAADANAESLNTSITELQRLVRQVSTAAQQVSDAGTMIGRGLVVLERSTNTSPPAVQTEIAPAKPAEPKQLMVQPAHAEMIATADPQLPPATATNHEPTARADSIERSTPSSGPRPAWVDAPPKRVGNTWREVIPAGEYATDEECDMVADAKLMLATYRHLQQLAGEPLSDVAYPTLSVEDDEVTANGGMLLSRDRKKSSDARINALRDMGIGIDYIRHVIAKDEYRETVQRSFGEMRNLYTQIEFNSSVDRELRERWDVYQRQSRFTLVGVGAGSVLGLLGLALGLLKVDTWTKGYYTKRLFLGVPAAIIGLVALAATFAGALHGPQ